MRRIVLVFGLVAGVLMSLMLVVTVRLADAFGNGWGGVVGYATMVVAFLCVFYGIRAYRDEVAGGMVSFGRACAVGLLITVVASACYVATWEVVYFRFMPDYADRFAARVLAEARANGASPAELQARARELAEFQVKYRDPVYNAAVTFLEPLPVGVVMTLVSAGLLRRRRVPRRDDAPTGEASLVV